MTTIKQKSNSTACHLNHLNICACGTHKHTHAVQCSRVCVCVHEWNAKPHKIDWNYFSN